MRGVASRWTLHRGPQVYAWVTLVVLVTNTGWAQSTASPPGGAFLRRLTDRVDQALIVRCLTPETSTAMNGVVSSGALRSILGTEFTLERGSVDANQIQLEIGDAAQRKYRITLASPGARDDHPDGEGERFLFHVDAGNPPNAKAKDVLLAMAKAFDAAIPDTALAPCTGGNRSEAGERRYPRSIALLSAIAQVAVVLVTILFGLVAVRALRDDEVAQQ